MKRLITSTIERDQTARTIFAYGFDAAGFVTRNEPQELADGSKVEFLNFNDPQELSLAEGVIVPQGIFETIEIEKKTIWGPKSAVLVDKWALLERERQVFNMLRAGSWVCFLVGEVIDELVYGISREPINDTDLCKRLLNAFGVGRHHRYNLAAPVEVKTRDKEFDSYIAAYGRPTTVFDLPRGESIERRVLVELTTNSVVGVEFDHQLFFLPFDPPARTWKSAVAIAKTIGLAVSRYRQKWSVVIPNWIDELRFKSEEALYLQINSLLEKVNRLENQLDSWRDYKAILTTSGGALMNRIIAILESFFELRVRRLEGRPDAALLKPHQSDESPLVFFEAKSAAGEIERSWIDDLKIHKRAVGLPESTPGVLFVNPDLSTRDINRRLEQIVSQQLVEHAKAQGVLLIRTIDLLFLMQQMENGLHRSTRMLELCSSGGGWLKADLEHYQLVA
jgi:hypothetical protein